MATHICLQPRLRNVKDATHTCAKSPHPHFSARKIVYCVKCNNNNLYKQQIHFTHDNTTLDSSSNVTTYNSNNNDIFDAHNNSLCHIANNDHDNNISYTSNDYYNIIRS